jgi:hypothetical protein
MRVASAKTGIVKVIEPTLEQLDKSPKQPKKRHVEIEYNRRLEKGFSHDLKDERGSIFIKTTEKAQKGWERVTKRASVLRDLGDADTTINIRSKGVKVAVTGPEWLAILKHATDIEQELFEKFTALVEMSPIPMDFADDRYWIESSE